MQQQAPAPVAVQIKAEDVKQLREMFPGVAQAEIERILAVNNGQLEPALNALLSSS